MRYTQLVANGLVLMAGYAVALSAQEPSIRRCWTFDRDARGRVVHYVDPAGRDTHFTYEGDALQQIAYGDGTQVSLRYTPAGRLESMVDPTGTTIYEFDPLGRPASITPPGGPRISYEIDLRGRLRRMELSDGWFAAYHYDVLDRLAKVESPVGEIIYVHRPAELVDGVPAPSIQRKLPNGVISTWTFDADMRLTVLRHDRGDELLAGWSYAYDAGGRVAALRDLVSNKVFRHSYDSLGQLTEVSADGAVLEGYRYDTGSNQVEASRLDTTTRFEYDRLSQLSGIDDMPVATNVAGDMTRDPVSSSSFGYDGCGRLIRVSTDKQEVQYRYGGDGTLVERRCGPQLQRFVYHQLGPVPEVVAVLDSDSKPLIHFLLGPDRLAACGRDGQAQYLLEDHLHSVRVIVDGQGQVVARRDYSAFGASQVIPTEAGGFGFAGEWHDPATGLVFLRARWYDPRIGRFLSRDPWFGSLAAPASLNPYAYAGNDPVNFRDQSGLAPEPVDPRSVHWTDVKSGLEIGRQLIEARIVHNFQLMDETPPCVSPFYNGYSMYPSDPKAWVAAQEWQFRTIGGYIANFGWQFTAEAWSFAAGVWTQTQTAGESWGLHWADPSRMSAGQAWWETAKAAWEVGSLLGGKIAEGVKLTPGVSSFLSRSGMLNRAITAGTTPALNRAAVQVIRGAQATGRTLEVADHAKTLGGLGLDAVKAWRALRPPAEGAGGGSPALIDRLNDPLAPRTNVGGVWMEAFAQGLRELGPVAGASYDRKTGRLVLFSEAAGEATAAVNVEFLAAALRSLSQGQWPGVSIDPDPKNPMGPTMYYRYIGPVERTYAGYVMAYADRLMKLLGMGQDNEDPTQTIRSHVPGFKDQFEWSFEKDSDTGRHVWSRFWLVPGRIEWASSPDGQLVCCRAPVKVNTQVMQLRGGEFVPAPGQRDPSAEAFAGFFSREYDKLAREFPVYEELREFAKMVSLAAWLRQTMPPDDFRSLVEAFVPTDYDTPTTTPSMTLTRERETGNRVSKVTIFGGVDLKTELPSKLPPDAKLKPLAEAIIESTTEAGPPAVREIEADGRRYRTLPVPFRTISSVGSLTLHVSDLTLSQGGQEFALNRHYDSRCTRPGPFGRGWQIVVPELRFDRRDGEEVPLLTDSWRTFEHPVKAPEFRSIARGPEGTRLTAGDGSVWEFTTDQKLARCRSGTSDLRLRYDQGRLAGISLSGGGKTREIKLTCDDSGAITRATEGEQTIDYRYDEKQRLVEVRSAQGVTRYNWDQSDHLTEASDQDGTRRFEIEPDGFLARYVSADGQMTTYSRQNRPEGGVSITSSTAGAPGVLLDANGAPVGLQGDGWLLRSDHQPEVTSEELRVNDKMVARSQYLPARRSLVREFPGDRSEQYELGEDAAPLSAEITSSGDGSATELRFNNRGELLSMSDPAGGAYQWVYGPQDRLTSITTPSGSYAIQTDAQGRLIGVDSPAGRQWRIAHGPDQLPDLVSLKDRGFQIELARTAPRRWELRQAGKSTATLATDEQGRVVEWADPAGATRVLAQHGDGGSVVRSPEGRQILTRRNSAGEIVEVQEYAAGVSRLSPPLADLTGRREASEKLQELARMKRR